MIDAANEASRKPSMEGLLRYEPNGMYEGRACTCNSDCPRDCKGHCGCEACSLSWSDYQSCDY